MGQLVSGVAHELNNPLSVIIDYSQLLATRKLPDNVTRPLERILQQADRTAKIVQSLLLFARQHPPEHARLDLTGSSSRRWRCGSTSSRSREAVERDFAAGLPAISGDPHQLQQVFLNLLVNAEQAITGAGKHGGRIVFRMSAGDDGRVVRVSVIDDGPGIAPETLPHVFEPFFTTKDVGVGTGLGPSVSYGIGRNTTDG